MSLFGDAPEHASAQIAEVVDVGPRRAVPAGACPEPGAARCGARPDVTRYFELPAVMRLLEDEGLDAASARALARLVSLEWAQFDRVRGMGGRARCQDDARSFVIYRLAQYLAFPHELIPLVLADLVAAESEGRNLVAEKYARMMRVTDSERYARDWAGVLRAPSPVRAEALGELAHALEPLISEAAAELPRAGAHARRDLSASGEVSALDYFVAEAAGWSLGTLWCLCDALAAQRGSHVNPVARTYELSVLAQRALGE